MKNIKRTIAVSLLTAFLTACGSDGASSSSGGEISKDASNCISRSLGTVYVNECAFDVNVILLKPGASSFNINANDAETGASGGSSFGACRAPSIPVPNTSYNSYSCS